jgi:hypothetical protein
VTELDLLAQENACEFFQMRSSQAKEHGRSIHQFHGFPAQWGNVSLALSVGAERERQDQELKKRELKNSVTRHPAGLTPSIS